KNLSNDPSPEKSTKAPRTTSTLNNADDVEMDHEQSKQQNQDANKLFSNLNTSLFINEKQHLIPKLNADNLLILHANCTKLLSNSKGKSSQEILNTLNNIAVTLTSKLEVQANTIAILQNIITN